VRGEPGEGSVHLQWHCQQRLTALFHALDERAHERFVTLFDDEGVWVRSASTLQGRVQIAASLAQRSPTMVRRHLLSNFLVLRAKGNEMDVSCFLTTYGADSEHPMKMPAQVEGPLGIFGVQATFRQRASEVWVTRLEMRPEFGIKARP
jgi:hypothetical protein